MIEINHIMNNICDVCIFVFNNDKNIIYNSKKIFNSWIR